LLSPALTVCADGIRFRLIDTGIGIGQEDLAHLFESFFQADATLSRRHSGAGVGLAICGELARLMGGAIEASSELGGGSTFELRLPLTPVSANVESAIRKNTRADGLSGFRKPS